MSISKALKEHFYIGCLSESDQAKAHLISRYWSKVSSRLHGEYKELLIEGKDAFDERIKHIVYAKNPLLEMIKKDNSFEGKYLPIPIEYNK